MACTPSSAVASAIPLGKSLPPSEPVSHLQRMSCRHSPWVVGRGRGLCSQNGGLQEETEAQGDRAPCSTAVVCEGGGFAHPQGGGGGSR